MIIKPISILLIYTKTNIIIYDHQTDKTNFLHRAVKFKRFHKNVKSKNAIKIRLDNEIDPIKWFVSWNS